MLQYNKTMPSFTDTEFGEIIVRRSAKARQVRLRIAPDGKLRASMPVFASMLLVKRFVADSRDDIRELLGAKSQMTTYQHGMRIGKSHMLEVANAPRLKIKTAHQRIVVGLPVGTTIDALEVQQAIRSEVTGVLRREAKAFLPRRLAYLAEHYGFSYKKVRFSHAGSRWGSCSSTGTISLNIALMKLPHELIDYVLYHELSHTKQLNHSKEFWQLVQSCDPEYLAHRQQLRQQHPYV